MQFRVQIVVFVLGWALPGLWAQEDPSRTTIVIPPGEVVPVTTPAIAEPVAELGYSGRADDPARPVGVHIVSPQAQELVAENPVDVFFAVENYTLVEGGNRLHVILDNEAPRPVWNLKKPLTLRNLPEGGHTIRVLVVKPDGVALTEPGAFAMTTFFLRRKGFENFVPEGSPVLTVNQPVNGFIDLAEGESVWFDFKALNAPLVKGGGYAIQYQLNKGEGLITDEKPIYWTQVKPGRYELIAQLVDNNLQPLPGVFNSVKRIFEVRLAPRARPLGSAVPVAPGETGRPPQP